MKENQDLIQTIIEGIQEKKGKQIITADLSEIESSSAQYFIICQGGSPAQVAAIADSVRETTLQKIGVKPFNYDGYKTRNGLLSITVISMYISSNPNRGNIIISKSCGVMPN